jgi:hypothetical protein
MKKLITICLVCVLTAAAWGNIIITFDENGNGTTKDVSGSITPLISGGGGAAGPLFYELSYAVSDGVLAVMEPDGSISDILNFSDGLVFVYSEAEPGLPENDKADTGIPSYLLPLISLRIDEVGLEGINGATYTPTPGQPGYWQGANEPVTYVFISDIPEPATMVLLGLGALSLIRRKK